MGENGYKAIFFDLCDTLFEFTDIYHNVRDKALKKISEDYCIEIDLLKERYAKIHRKTTSNQFIDGRLSYEYRRERFELLLGSFGKEGKGFLDALMKEYNREYESKYVPLPGLHDVIPLLASRYELYLTTEAPRDTPERILRFLKIENHIKCIYSSGSTGMTKGDGSLFSFALKDSGLSPNEVLVVGDWYEKDVLGAKKAGIKAIWLNRKNQTGKGNEAFATISSLPELLEILEVEKQQQAAGAAGSPETCG